MENKSTNSKTYFFDWKTLRSFFKPVTWQSYRLKLDIKPCSINNEVCVNAEDRKSYISEELIFIFYLLLARKSWWGKIILNFIFPTLWQYACWEQFLISIWTNCRFCCIFHSLLDYEERIQAFFNRSSKIWKKI